MTEIEYIEEQKKALKSNIRVWTFVFIYFVVVGLLLCLILYGFIMLGMLVVNLVFFSKTKKFLKKIENGEVGVEEIYEFYEAMAGRNNMLFVANIFCGGLFGVIGTISDMRVTTRGMVMGQAILGDDYKNKRVVQDANARWKYCIYCKRNKVEVNHLYNLTDGVICSGCLSSFASMLPKRAEDPALLNARSTAHYIRPDASIGKLSSKDLEERLAYYKNNLEYYACFRPTKVICDGCLEIDEVNSLFRIVHSSEYDSAKAGSSSGLIHQYSEIKGIGYEKIYEYTPDSEGGAWIYSRDNSIILAIDNPYLREETFTLKRIPTDFFANSPKIQVEYAEQTVRELQGIFNKPIMESRKVRI